MKTLGILPLAGSGTRLKLPFHKSLAPVMSELGELTPVVEYSITRLSKICNTIAAITSEDSAFSFPHSHYNLLKIDKGHQGELPSSISAAAGYAVQNGFEYLALSLPDTLWWPEDGFKILLETLKGSQSDGTLGLFEGDARMLDEVKLDNSDRVSSVKLHESSESLQRQTLGWGCFIIKSESALLFDDSSPLAFQLNSLHLTAKLLEGPYFDIGTPKRFREVADYFYRKHD